MVKKNSFLIFFFMLFFVSACASNQITEPEYALSLTQRYEAVHETYKSQYMAIGNKQRDYMRENIAPVLDRAKDALVQYNKAVIAGKSSPGDKQEFTRLLRQASTQLLEIQNE